MSKRPGRGAWHLDGGQNFLIMAFFFFWFASIVGILWFLANVVDLPFWLVVDSLWLVIILTFFFWILFFAYAIVISEVEEVEEVEEEEVVS